MECYSTGLPTPGTPKEVAKACIEAGFRAYRISIDTRGPMVDRFENCFQKRQRFGTAARLVFLSYPLRRYSGCDQAMGASTPGLPVAQELNCAVDYARPSALRDTPCALSSCSIGREYRPVVTVPSIPERQPKIARRSIFEPSTG